jgi:hypothetical protein
MTASRYANVPTSTLTTADGRQVPYLRRRFLPAAPPPAGVRVHVVKLGERIDLIAYGVLGDPELSWVVADANLVMAPSDLERVGAAINLPGAAAPGGQLNV